jgi:DNA repair photolyase
MRIFAGLRQEDWARWGQFTTFKSNAPELLARELKPDQRIYCSPLVDPYQPAEAEERMMPRILEAVLTSPPRVFCLQTRGTLILRDVDLLRRIPNVRVSFSITTDRDDARKLYEPHCASFEERLETVRALRAAGVETFATLAPLLPCNPENLARTAIEATGRDPIGDPLHVRSVKPRGATTREAAFRIAEAQGHAEWLDADFQARIVERIDEEAQRAGFRFATGPQGFARLAK